MDPAIPPERLSAKPDISPGAVPVALVRIAVDGVPRFGVISVGLVERTTLPLPVEPTSLKVLIPAETLL